MELLHVGKFLEFPFLIQGELRLLGNSCKDNAIDAGGLGFESLVGQIGTSVANGSPPLRYFFGAVLLSRVYGPRLSLHASAYFHGYNEDLILENN